MIYSLIYKLNWEYHMIYWFLFKWLLLFQLIKIRVYYTLSLLTYTVFCTLPHRVQNRAIYHSYFIIACDVHFLKDNVILLDGKACALRVIEGKTIISFQNTQIPNLALFFFLWLSAGIFLEFWRIELQILWWLEPNSKNFTKKITILLKKSL